ncbi:MAG: DoxX family membrane protein [Halobacteriaceae archaeon]
MTHQLQITVLGRDTTMSISEKLIGYWVVFLRLLTGWWFFHAGVNKYVTPGEFSAGWFLAQQGTIVSPILNPLAGGWTEMIVNAVIPAGEILIGLGLILGCLTRLASFFGAVLMAFFYFGNEMWRRSFVNGDLLGVVVFLTILIFGAGRVWGIDAYLEQLEFVQSTPWLRYLLG